MGVWWRASSFMCWRYIRTIEDKKGWNGIDKTDRADSKSLDAIPYIIASGIMN